MKILTVKEAQALDRWAIEKMGIPSIALMENAGRGVAQAILNRFKGKNKPSVVIISGRGNNGGDGFVAARYLFNWGFKQQVFLIGRPSQLKTDALINYRVLGKLGIKVKSLDKVGAAFKKSLQSSDMVVDAIFGVGLNRPIEEPYYGIIEAINTLSPYTLAVDIPSGLDGTTGNIYGICIKAQMTATFTYPKKGFFRKDGPDYTGRVRVVDIGI